MSKEHREYQSKPTEKFIGNASFGFTEESVEKFFSEIREELEQIKKSKDELSPFSLRAPEESRNEDREDNLEQSAEEIPLPSLGELIADREKKIDYILKQSPENILTNLQEIYNFVRDLEEEGLAREQILRKIKKRPKLLNNLNVFYELLRKQNWGYNLKQELITVD